MNISLGFHGAQHVPEWVPRAAVHYLAHTEQGLSIRALARETNCHPSTILRQVRRFESRRDDPLIDDALRALAATFEGDQNRASETKAMKMDRWKGQADPEGGLTQDRIDQEAKRVLRRLCEQGAVMAVAREMETAVIVRETPQGDQLRTAVIDREIAQAMALKEWIACADTTGRIARYFVTNAGRAALRFHCCCLLEGLESTEKTMGWSARSGKIVLRIALQRLKRHYANLGDDGQMIG